MANFKVKLQAQAIVETEIEIEAPSASEAESMAIRQADLDPFNNLGDAAWEEWRAVSIEGCIDSVAVVEVK